MKASLLSFVITLALVTAYVCPTFRRNGPAQSKSGLEVSQTDSARAHPEKKTALSSDAEEPTSPSAVERAASLVAQVRELSSGTAADSPERWALICQLAELDPPLAITTLREASPYAYRLLTGNEESIVAWWAAKDPEDALAWYWEDARNGNLSPSPPAETIETLAATDVRRAAAFAMRWIAAGRERSPGTNETSSTDGTQFRKSRVASQALATLVPYLKSPDDLEPLLPVSRPGDGFVFADAWQGLASIVAKALSPAEARAFFDSHAFPSDWPKEYLHPAVYLMETAIKKPANSVPSDFPDWAAWTFRSVGDNEAARTQAAVNLVSNWTAQDPEAAGHWLREFTQTDPAAAPLAMRAYASAVLAEDPAAAMQWTGAIPQETTRRLTMVQLFSRWAGKDAPAAQAWLDSSNWPPEIKHLAAGALKAASSGY